MGISSVTLLPVLVMAVAILPIQRPEALPFPLLVPGKFTNLLKGFGQELFGEPSAAVGKEKCGLALDNKGFADKNVPYCTTALSTTRAPFVNRGF